MRCNCCTIIFTTRQASGKSVESIQVSIKECQLVETEYMSSIFVRIH
jgi:hypothetical protein